MKILQAKEAFGPVKKGDQLFFLPENRMLLSTIICLPFFVIPRFFTIELVGVILNVDEKRAKETNETFNSAPLKFIYRDAVGDDSYIYWVDARLLEEVQY